MRNAGFYFMCFLAILDFAAATFDFVRFAQNGDWVTFGVGVECIAAGLICLWVARGSRPRRGTVWGRV